MPPPAMQMEANSAAPKTMSIEFIERAAQAFQVAAVVFGTLAALATIGAWYFASKEAAEKGRALKQFQLESKERVALLEKEAEEARLKTAQIQSLVTWRSLSKEQLDILEKRLSQRPSKVSLAYVDDPESTFFAIEISKAFTGWSVISSIPKYGGRLVIGLTIVGTSEPEVAFVRDAFSAAKIPFSVNPIKGGGGLVSFGTVRPVDGIYPGVEIIVGCKPRPELGR